MCIQYIVDHLNSVGADARLVFSRRKPSLQVTEAPEVIFFTSKSSSGRKMCIRDRMFIGYVIKNTGLKNLRFEKDTWGVLLGLSLIHIFVGGGLVILGVYLYASLGENKAGNHQ